LVNEEVSREVKDEVVKPAIRLFARLAKLSADKLVAALEKAIQEKKYRKENVHGEMKVKDLIRKDQGAQAIDIDGAGLGDFRKIANKYGVDFAIVKSTELDPPKYSVFFKARDADALNAVVNEYTAKQLRIEKEGRPSILAKLSKFKEIVAAMPKKAIEKHKEVAR
jgi:hypothetical protein